jgi:hypothetical protein
MLVDANLLLYAKIREYPEHGRARAWLDGVLNADFKVGIAWPTVQAFVRISTNARLFPRALSPDLALRQVEEWLALPNVWSPLPTERHLETLGRVIRQARAVGNLVSDAELAALALQHGLELQSTDGDFARFSGLRWKNPLA